jgi:hypothetical protein
MLLCVLQDAAGVCLRLKVAQRLGILSCRGSRMAVLPAALDDKQPALEGVQVSCCASFHCNMESTSSYRKHVTLSMHTHEHHAGIHLENTGCNCSALMLMFVLLYVGGGLQPQQA